MSLTLTETENTVVSHIVNTSIDDARNSLRSLHPEEGVTAPKLEENLRLLRVALEREKAGSNRTSLVSLLRSAIRANETALEGLDRDDAPAVELETEGEEVPAEASAAAPDEVDPTPLVHLRFAGKSAFAHHPKLANIPMPGRVLEFLEGRQDAGRAADLSEELTAFRNGVYHAGIIEPLKVVPCPPLLTGADDGIRWWIVDGRTRHEAAGDDDEIPFVEVDPSDVDDIIEATVAGRRNWTKGQKAYLAVLRNPHLLEVSQGERADLRTECASLSREDIATRFGISIRLLVQAIELVRAMENLREGYPQKVEDAEMQVWAGDGLASILSGLKGFEVTVGKPKPTGAFAVVSRHLCGVARSAKNFAAWNQAEMMHFRDAVDAFWQTLPKEAGDFLTLVRVGDTRAVEALIAKREAAKLEGEGAE